MNEKSDEKFGFMGEKPDKLFGFMGEKPDELFRLSNLTKSRPITLGESFIFHFHLKVSTSVRKFFYCLVMFEV